MLSVFGDEFINYVKAGNIKKVKELLKKYKGNKGSLLNYTDPFTRATPLHFAW
jgi:hypothetical protein